MQKALLRFQITNQLVDVLKHALVEDAGRQFSVLRNFRVDLDALFTHGRRHVIF